VQESDAGDSEFDKPLDAGTFARAVERGQYGVGHLVVIYRILEGVQAAQPYVGIVRRLLRVSQDERRRDGIRDGADFVRSRVEAPVRVKIGKRDSAHLLQQADVEYPLEKGMKVCGADPFDAGCSRNEGTVDDVRMENAVHGLVAHKTVKPRFDRRRRILREGFGKMYAKQSVVMPVQEPGIRESEGPGAPVVRKEVGTLTAEVEGGIMVSGREHERRRKGSAA